LGFVAEAFWDSAAANGDFAGFKAAVRQTANLRRAGCGSWFTVMSGRSKVF
jgi:hypothetical protein